jgi:hypothetical protein
MASTLADSSSFVEAAVEGLRQQTSAHSATWHLGQEQNWAADLHTGSLVLTFADGTVATAAIQVVGTYNTLDGTFLWGWDHPSVPEALRSHARLAKQWGESAKVSEFTERIVKCSEDDAWRFAAVANRLAHANGVYRGRAGTTLVFMTFGEVKLEKSGH